MAKNPQITQLSKQFQQLSTPKITITIDPIDQFNQNSGARLGEDQPKSLQLNSNILQIIYNRGRESLGRHHTQNTRWPKYTGNPK
jgi:hypothetical protein